MRHLRSWTGVLLTFTLAASAVGGTGTDAPDRDPETFFEGKVRPVLAGTCVKCHGPTKASGGLRLDSREAVLRGGDNGPAVVPGDAAASLLLKAVSHADDDLKMPPNKPLAKEARADLSAWVAAGAFWPKAGAVASKIEADGHWAFAPLKPVEPPADPSGWAVDPVDRFIAAGHRREGVRPVGEADRRALIRRVTFDLTGLPPTPDEVEAFVADTRPDAYARLVDTLLASPRYGERWGRYWLDLARYADTAGDNSDYPIPQAYLYRDYVIDAFNADLPYDRFLHEQLAGDLLAREGTDSDRARQVIATGFVAQAKRFGTHKLEDIHQIIEDTLNTTGQVVLGLSLRCARCHDHKYDPVSTRDYYALYGFFAGTQYPFAGSEEDKKPSEFAPLLSPAEVKEREARHAETVAKIKAEVARLESDGPQARRVRELDAAVTEAEAEAKQGESSARAEREKKVETLRAERDAAKASLAAAFKPVKAELAKAEKASPLEGAPLAYAVRDRKPTDVKVQVGGDPRRTGPLVPRGVLKVLDDGRPLNLPVDQSGRLQLARWLTTGRAGDLAARVMANRVWQHHFGKPVVPTPSDFGLRGTPPTHPELLDWLARDFIASGWSVKSLHRRILLSKTYRLASTVDAETAARDSGNAWYWRADRRPLDAEALRDTLLTLGGDLDLARPGPHPFPPASKWSYTAHHQFKAVYESNHRSVYLMVQRLHPHPYLALFNGPDTSVTTAVRDDSSVPLQALFLLNSPFVHDQAGRFAGSLLADRPDDPARVRLAYLKAYARPPSDTEAARAGAFLADYRRSATAEGTPAGRADREAWSALTRVLLASNEFLYVD